MNKIDRSNTTNYALRAIPADQWRTAVLLARAEGTTMRAVLLKAVQDYAKRAKQYTQTI